MCCSRFSFSVLTCPAASFSARSWSLSTALSCLRAWASRPRCSAYAVWKVWAQVPGKRLRFQAAQTPAASITSTATRNASTMSFLLS